MMQGRLTADETQDLQLQLAELDAMLRERGFDVQQQGLNLEYQNAQMQDRQQTNRPGLDAEDLATRYDLIRRGLL
jgi:hypothetical protein